MADVRSKNLYELLGNDPELDPNRVPEPPTKALDKPAPRHGKRDAPKEAPVRSTEEAPRRAGRGGGNDAAFRDRNAGSRNNRDKPVDEAGQEPNSRPDRGGRGGRGGRHDRQSRTGQSDTRKQVNQGWGNQDGEKTWDDEKAGENIAQTDENQPQTPAEEKPEEPEDKSKSFAEYLAEKAARGDLSAKPVRAANEGSKTDKKWASAKEIKRAEEEEAYIKGKEEKSKREKQRKEKNFLDVDMRFVEAPRGGGSGGPRGGGRGRGAPRGAPRGGARGAPRGGRGNGPRSERPAPVTVDETNFPSLGGK
ncbi:Stm1-domain-containing protein [Aspergillus cavernicola]|uniref:Stm1-domain-containing protein n=1 Tax=Aspergillus cavernicola TaxID=176166 RepID=A0ABR4HDE0_9EURO